MSGLASVPLALAGQCSPLLIISYLTVSWFCPNLAPLPSHDVYPANTHRKQ